VSALRPTKPPVPSLSWLLRVAALLVLVAPLGPTLHLVGTAHHVCPEHGEVEHGAQSHAPPQIAARPDAVPTAGGIVDPVPSDPAHEHCDTVGLLKTASRLAPVTVLVVHTSLPQPTASCHSRPACPGTAPLDVAPKTSPPVSA